MNGLHCVLGSQKIARHSIDGLTKTWPPPNYEPETDYQMVFSLALPSRH
jgi:hypothetical protein